MEFLFEFTTPAPKHQQQVVTLNNVGKWYRFQGSKIKNEYKEMLKEWHIPKPKATFDYLLIEFHISRHVKRTLDSDNIGFIVKWTIDAIKEINWEWDYTGSKPKIIAKHPGWMVDDDNVEYNVKPSILDKTLLETEFTVKVFGKNVS